MESDPQERESDDNSMSHNDEPLSDGDVDSGHDQDDSCEGMKQIANGQTLTDHNDVLNKLKRQVREIRGGDDYEPERPVNFSTPHKSMPIPEPGPFHVPPIYSNYQNAAAAAAAFMTPLVPPQQPQPNPVSSGGSSLSSNDSGSHNWSFEEQFKQVRQLYELDNAPGRREFLDELFAFMQQRGTPINRLPIMAKSVLDLFNLYNLVISRGGLVEVINKKLWQEIIKGLKLPSSITSAAFTLRTQYMKYLYEYETEKMNLSTREELQAAIDSNRREGRRTSYGTYESAMRHPDTSMVVAHLNNQMAPLPPMVQAAAAAAAAAAHQQQQQQQLAVHLSNAMSLSNGLAHPHNGPSASPASHLPPLPPHGGHLVPPTSHAPGSSSAANGVPAPGAGTELEQRMIDFFNTQVLLQQHNATIFQAGQNMDLSRLALFSQIASSLNNQRQAAILAAAAQQQHHQQQQQQQQNLMNNEHQQHQEQQQQQRQSPAAPFRFGLPHHSPPLPMSALAMMEQMNRATSPEQHEALNLSDPNSQGPSGLNGSAVAAVAGNSNCNTSGRRGKKRPSRSSTPLEQQQQEKRRPGSANSTHPVVNNGNHLPSTSDEPGSDQRLNGEVLIHRPDHVQQNRHNTNAMYKHDTNQAHQQHSLNGAMTLDGGRQLSEDEDEDVEEEERDEVDDEDMDVVEADRTLQQDHDDEHQQPQPQPAHTSANNNSSGNVQVSSLQTTSISINSQGGNGETKSLLVKMDLNGVAYEGVLFPRPVPQ